MISTSIKKPVNGKKIGRDSLNKGYRKVSADSSSEKDVATVSIINGLNFLISKANNMGIYAVSRTLNAAKEDLVYWAVQMNYHETLEEKFVNRYLYEINLHDAEDLKTYMFSDVSEKKA